MEKRGMSTSFKVIGGYAIIFVITLFFAWLPIISLQGVIGNISFIGSQIELLGGEVTQITKEDIPIDNIVTQLRIDNLNENNTLEKILRNQQIEYNTTKAELDRLILEFRDEVKVVDQ
jgi:hypothetical protein